MHGVLNGPLRERHMHFEGRWNKCRKCSKNGVIRESNSPWSVPTILVTIRSLDGKPIYRFRVDLRALNAVTKFDSYPHCSDLTRQTPPLMALNIYCLRLLQRFLTGNIKEEHEDSIYSSTRPL